MSMKLLCWSLPEGAAIGEAVEEQVDRLAALGCLCSDCRERLRLSRGVLQKLKASFGAGAPGATH